MRNKAIGTSGLILLVFFGLLIGYLAWKENQFTPDHTLRPGDHWDTVNVSVAFSTLDGPRYTVARQKPGTDAYDATGAQNLIDTSKSGVWLQGPIDGLWVRYNPGKSGTGADDTLDVFISYPLSKPTPNR